MKCRHVHPCMHPSIHSNIHAYKCTYILFVPLHKFCCFLHGNQDDHNSSAAAERYNNIRQHEMHNPCRRGSYYTTAATATIGMMIESWVKPAPCSSCMTATHAALDSDVQTTPRTGTSTRASCPHLCSRTPADDHDDYQKHSRTTKE